MLTRETNICIIIIGSAEANGDKEGPAEFTAGAYIKVKNSTMHEAKIRKAPANAKPKYLLFIEYAAPISQMKEKERQTMP